MRFIVAFLALLLPLQGADRPNILWITSEDNSAFWLGCYGNKQAQTPVLDAFAKRSIQFDRAYSSAPVCAVARCTLLTGIHAVSLGTQNMRSRYAIPDDVKPAVTYLREAGYYCTNNVKTDYNFAGDDKRFWDVCLRNAHFRNCPPDQPFYSVINLTVSHESSLFPHVVARNREKGIIPKETRLSPDEINLPPYLPDLPEIRQDFAIYHDVLTALDTQVGKILQELEDSGRAENTIVFYFSDHGGPTPRTKRYLYETGVHVPFLLHIPEKWKHLAIVDPESMAETPISFEDFAPTLMDIVGLKKDPKMQGSSFLKPQLENEIPGIFLSADRFDGITGMRRAVVLGNYKYIRDFVPFTPRAPYSFYPLQMPSWQAWHTVWKNDALSPQHSAYWQHEHHPEEIYDLKNDPYELHNLADDPEHSTVLRAMRKLLFHHMSARHDTGVVPEALSYSREHNSNRYQEMRHHGFDHESLLKFAINLDSNSIDDSAPHLGQLTQYWAALHTTRDLQTEFAPIRKELSTSKITIVAAQACVALYQSGEKEAALTAFARLFQREISVAEGIALVNACLQIQRPDIIPDPWKGKHHASEETGLDLGSLLKEMHSLAKPQ